MKIAGADPNAGNAVLGRVFAEAARQLGGDLILTGVQSAGDRDGQLGPIMAARMGIPAVSVVTGVNVAGKAATLKKEYSGGIMAEFEVEMPAVLAEALKNLDEQGNSFGESNRRRSRWMKELDFEIKDAAAEPVQYLWFVGDFASFNADCQQVSRKVVLVLHAAGVDFGILHRGEHSAGNDVRRVGEEGLFESLAEKNIEALARCEFERIFTTDPHTFNTLKNEYPRLGGDFEVQHYSTLLLELIRDGTIPLKRKVGAKATYHDPCYLGRYNGVFDAPREILALCGVELVEMPRNRENSFCCGAGGGRVWMKDHDQITERPSEGRIREAAALDGVAYFTVACPKELSMYGDAVKTAGLEGKMEVRDLIDFVMEATEWSGAKADDRVAWPVSGAPILATGMPAAGGHD